MTTWKEKGNHDVIFNYYLVRDLVEGVVDEEEKWPVEGDIEERGHQPDEIVDEIVMVRIVLMK